MILADTSVWIDHLRKSDPVLSAELDAENVVMHAFVVAELALGSIKNRVSVVRALSELPRISIVREAELMRFIEARRLHGSGVGFVDAHLLAAAQLTPGTQIATRDKSLAAAAARLGLLATN